MEKKVPYFNLKIEKTIKVIIKLKFNYSSKRVIYGNHKKIVINFTFLDRKIR